MTTPLIMLALMIAPYAIVRAWAALSGRRPASSSAGAAGLGLLFVFTGIGHFVQTEAMVAMLPPWVPQRAALVYLTGLAEFVVAVGFFLPSWRRAAGWAAAVMLVGFFPANIYAAFQFAPMGGHAWGPVYLWIRAPLQLAILAWLGWFVLMQPLSSHRSPHRA